MLTDKTNNVGGVKMRKKTLNFTALWAISTSSQTAQPTRTTTSDGGKLTEKQCSWYAGVLKFKMEERELRRSFPKSFPPVAGTSQPLLQLTDVEGPSWQKVWRDAYSGFK